MSLLGFDGFTQCQYYKKDHWLSTPGYEPTTGRDGSVNGAAYHDNTAGSAWVLPAPKTVLYIGSAINHPLRGASSTASSSRLFGFYTTAIQSYLWVNSIGMIELRLGATGGGAGTLLATSSGHAPIEVSDWHHIQVKAQMHLTAGIMQIRLNGVQVMNWTGQTAGATGDITRFYIGASSTGNTGGPFYDDMWVSDDVDATATQGRPNIGFLGDLKVSALVPNGVGDQSELVPSTAVANWTTVDENPMSGADYNGSSVVGARDLYQLTDLPAAAVSVFGVRSYSWMAKSDAGLIQMSPVIKEGGVVTVAPAAPLLTTGTPIGGPARYVKPSDSAVFTVAQVNSMQSGAQVAS